MARSDTGTDWHALGSMAGTGTCTLQTGTAAKVKTGMLSERRKRKMFVEGGTGGECSHGSRSNRRAQVLVQLQSGMYSAASRSA